MDFSNPFEAFYPSERYTFFQNNPFCEIDSMDKYKEKIKMRDLEEALSRFSL